MVSFLCIISSNMAGCCLMTGGLKRTGVTHGKETDGDMLKHHAFVLFSYCLSVQSENSTESSQRAEMIQWGRAGIFFSFVFFLRTAKTSTFQSLSESFHPLLMGRNLSKPCYSWKRLYKVLGKRMPACMYCYRVSVSVEWMRKYCTVRINWKKSSSL